MKHDVSEAESASQTCFIKQLNAGQSPGKEDCVSVWVLIQRGLTCDSPQANIAGGLNQPDAGQLTLIGEDSTCRLRFVTSSKGLRNP